MEIIRMASAGATSQPTPEAPQIQTRAGREEYAFIGSYIKGDIKKDHPQGYIERIANDIIAESRVVRYAPVMEKEDLLDTLITLIPTGQTITIYNTNIYKTLQNLPHDASGEIRLNLFNRNCIYTFKVFDRANVNAEDIKQFTLGGRGGESRILLTSDTTHHKEEILSPEINEKYSRESIWDPASRTAVGKCTENYGENPTGVLYRKFEGDLTDKLSYLFLKYDIYLVNQNNKVHLEYRKGDTLIRVNGDSNKAGLVLDIYNKVRQCFINQVSVPAEKIESRYVAKYSGDGCLRVSQFRNTVLNPGGGAGGGAGCMPTTSEYDVQLNETIDGNYFTGLLAAQSDAIWLHTNDKKRLIVFSKVIDPDRYNEEKLKMLNQKLKKDLRIFNANKDNYIRLSQELGEYIENFKRYFDTYAPQSYVDTLKNFTNYSILYKKCLELQTKYSNRQATIERSEVLSAAATLTIGREEQLTIENIKSINEAIHPFLTYAYDVSWKDVLFKRDGTLQDVTIEDLIVRKLAPNQWRITYESVFNAVNPDATSSPTLASRVTRLFTSKTPSAWGLDILKKVYTILEEIDRTAGAGGASGGTGGTTSARNSLSHTFIDKLKESLTPTKKTEFVSLLGNIGITYTGSQSGGAYLHKKTYKSKKRVRKTRKIYKQHGGAINKEQLEEELRVHLTFLTNFSKANTTDQHGGNPAKTIFESSFGYFDTPASSRAVSGAPSSGAVSGAPTSGDVPIEIVLDPLEFYENILGKGDQTILILLNRYNIVDYVNKNSFRDIEESIKRIRVTAMPDPLPDAVENSNDSFIKILTKEVTIEAIDKVIKNIIAIRVICKRDIYTDAEYTVTTDDIDRHLGEAHEFLKVAEVAYEAEKEYLSSRYDKAIEYLQEVLTLYPVVVVAGAAAAGASTVAAGASTPIRTATGEFFTPTGPGRGRGGVLPSSPAPTIADSSLEAHSAPPDSAPPARLSVEVGSDNSFTASNVSGAHASRASDVPSAINDRSATKIFLDNLNLSLMDKLKFTIHVIRDTKNKLASNDAMGSNSRPTPAGGASARRLTFNTGSNRRNQSPRRKTQRKPRR
jgi:hypothetical protein